MGGVPPSNIPINGGPNDITPPQNTGGFPSQTPTPTMGIPMRDTPKTQHWGGPGGGLWGGGVLWERYPPKIPQLMGVPLV